MNAKRMWIGVTVVVVVAAAVWFSIGSKPNEDKNTQQAEQNSNNSQTPTPTPSQTQGNGINGTLKASDNHARGNLMLVTDTQTIYIHTSRDFSALVGKNVTMTIDGPVTSFTLLDIVPQN